MKILFVIRAIAHFTYHESIIRELCADGHEVDVIFDREWSKNDPGKAANAFAETHTLVTLGWSMRRADVWRKRLFAARELLSYSSYLNRPGQAQFYAERWSKYVLARRRLKNSTALRNLLKTSFVGFVLRRVVRLAPADKAIKTWLKHNAYTAVVASPTNMRFSEATDFIKAANELGIATIVPVMTWDNLTTKGLIHEEPSLTLVWNKTQLREAVDIHDIPSDKVVVTGSPFLDKWFRSDRPFIEDSEFYHRMGMSDGEPYILYLGSSTNIANDESWLVEELAVALRNSDVEKLRSIKVLIRPHGANQDVFRRIDAPNIRLKLREDQVPDSPDAFAEFDASLRNCVCVAGLNTTGMVDALVSGRPVVALMVKEYADTNASKAIHFKHILDAGVYHEARTVENAVTIIGRLLDGVDEKRDARTRFTRDFVRPYGAEISAGTVASKAIVMAAVGKNAAQIQQEIRSLEIDQRVAVV